MKLKSKNGMVEYLMAAGKDVVFAHMPEERALQIIENGKQEESETHKGFPLCVDGKFYFPVIVEPKQKKSAKR